MFFLGRNHEFSSRLRVPRDFRRDCRREIRVARSDDLEAVGSHHVHDAPALDDAPLHGDVLDVLALRSCSAFAFRWCVERAFRL